MDHHSSNSDGTRPHESAPTSSRGLVTAGDIRSVLRSHWVLFSALGLIVMLAVSGIGIARTSGEPVYHAEALVVATELEIRVESLPRTASAIFNGGTVARRTAELAGTGIDPDDLIPEVIEIQPLENTGVIEVDAEHTDPETAAIYANAAAQALVEELNSVGPGLGTFRLQIEAAPPANPIEESLLPFVGLSVVAGLLIVLGTAGLYAVLRSRPERDPETVHATTPIARPPDQSEPAKTPSIRSVPGPLGVKAEQARPGEIRNLPPNEHSMPAGWEFESEQLPPSPPIHPLSSSVEQAETLIGSIAGIGPVFGARLASVGITTISQLAKADPRAIADAVEVSDELVIDWIRQAVGLTSVRYRTKKDR